MVKNTRPRSRLEEIAASNRTTYLKSPDERDIRSREENIPGEQGTSRFPSGIRLFYGAVPNSAYCTISIASPPQRPSLVGYIKSQDFDTVLEAVNPYVVKPEDTSSNDDIEARECVSLQPLPESPERHNPESPERHNVEKREFSPAEDPAASEDIESEIVIVENCTTRYKHIQLGDKEEVTRYYESLIRLIGQLSLKKILKAWIREIQPRKQAENPYNGGKYKSLSIKMYGDDNLGAMTAPSWWPPCFQRKDKARCRHREPDHQIKPERMILAMWLLRCFYAEDLEKATLDIGPKLDPKFQKRVPELLRELYAFRKREEAMTAGGCDETSRVIARDYKLKPLQPPIEYCDAPHDGPYKTPISQERKSVPPKSSRGSPQRRIRSIESIQEPQSNDVDYLHSPGRQPQQISGDLITMNDYPPAYPYQPPQESPYSSAFAYNQQHTIESLSMVAPCAFPLGAPITHMVDPPDLCRNLSDSNKSVHDNPFCLSQRYSSRPDRGYELSYEPFNGVNSASQTRQQRVTVDPISFSSDLSVPDQFDEGNLYGVN